jgi:hypothetical protein
MPISNPRVHIQLLLQQGVSVGAKCRLTKAFHGEICLLRTAVAERDSLNPQHLGRAAHSHYINVLNDHYTRLVKHHHL